MIWLKLASTFVGVLGLVGAGKHMGLKRYWAYLMVGAMGFGAYGVLRADEGRQKAMEHISETRFDVDPSMVTSPEVCECN